MAIIGTFSVETIAKGVVKATWTGLTAVGPGRALDAFAYPDKTVTFRGTFGSGATVVIEGSSTATNPLVSGATAYHTLTDQSDNALSLSTGKTEAIAQNPRYIRPRLTAKASSASGLSVTIIAQSLRR